MTEQEWLSCVDPQAMLKSIQGKTSDRKLRLFAVACCRRIWHLLTDKRSASAIEVAETFADALATEQARRSSEELAEIVRAAAQARYDSEVNDSTYAQGDEVIAEGWRLLTAADAAAAAKATTLVSAQSAAREASEASSTAEEWSVQSVLWSAGDGRAAKNNFEFSEKTKQGALLRCVVGNPFHPITVDPSWITATVLNLATAIYDEKAFDRMPILGDALEDAGCTNADVLAHCRKDKGHARGCWVVDLVLGKE